MCDHEGVVACYRTVKGLADLHRPRLTLAALDSGNDRNAAANAFQRFSGVCQQFLEWPVESESPVAAASGVTEHVVLWCSGTRDKAQLATAPQWQVVADFLSRANRTPQHSDRRVAADEAKHQPGQVAHPISAPAEPQSPRAVPAPVAPAEPVATPLFTSPAADTVEVIDLPDDRSTPAAIVSAMIRGGNALVECPVKAPMCPDASLAVSRNHRLVLVAVARQGLSDLRQIGRAYQWLTENRALIAMAVPQMSIDAHQMPQLQLLVDHADMSAEILQPMLQSAAVTVHAYRKLRWGGRTGLLLDAA
jgi:hypothetical protein